MNDTTQIDRHQGMPHSSARLDRCQTPLSRGGLGSTPSSAIRIGFVAFWCLIGFTQVNLRASAADSLSILEKSDSAGFDILIGGEPFAGYIADQNGAPAIYPIIGPDGQAMTRGFPIEPLGPNERNDHKHHRSLWLTHMDVNGVDFWHVFDKTGKVVQRDARAAVVDDVAVITTQNDWVGPDGNRQLSDVRRHAFFESDGRRVIDIDVLLIASDGDVRFGDNKDGAFGVRVAGTMKVDAGLGGQIVNASGQTDGDAWAQISPWVHYGGPVDGRPAGITIHNHPSSFGPCRWHVREYGLFAANPFLRRGEAGAEPTEGVVLPAGSTMRLNYRVVVSAGPFDPDRADADAKAYADTPRPKLTP